MSENPIQPIYSIESEQALIGSILVDPQLIRKLDITPEDFYLVKHKIIWAKLQELNNCGDAIDFISLENALNKTNQCKEIGGIAYLEKLADTTISIFHSETHADIVREKAKRRRVFEIAGVLANSAYDQERKLDGAVAKAVTDLVSSYRTKAGASPIEIYASRLYDEIDTASKNPQDIYGIPTGFYDIDRITYGLQLKEETILSGDPGLGKSLLAVQIGCNMAKAGYPGAIYEMEMGGIAIVRRQVPALSKIETYKMRQGKISEDEWCELTKAIETVSSLPVYISDESHWTTTGVRADLARLKELYDIKWFIADYLDLFEDLQGSDENTRSKHISGQIHAICKDLDLAGLMIHSINKTGMSSTTKSKANLSGSGKHSYDADQVVFHHQTQSRCKRRKPHVG